MVKTSSLLMQTLSKYPGAPPCPHKPLSPGQLQDGSRLPSNMASLTPTSQPLCAMCGGGRHGREGGFGGLSPL